MNHEIEIKALLTKEKYQELSTYLPTIMKQINQETLHTQIFTPGDLRLRHSDKTFEIVCKEKDPTRECRKELVIPLQSKDQLDKFQSLFQMLNLEEHKPWTTHKQEFEYTYNNYTYNISLQHTENFAYILEVEFLSEQDTTHIHEPNIKTIIKQLGCEPIDKQDFLERIKEYHSNSE